MDPTTTTNLGLGGPANPFLTGTTSNPYLQQNIANSQNDMVTAYNLAQAPGQNQAAINSGSFGNSGLQQEADQQANILQKNLGQLANTANLSDYQQQQQLYMQQQAANTSANQWNLGFGAQQQQQAYNQNMENLQAGVGLLGVLGSSNTGAYGQATTVQNAPANYWSTFENAANGIGQGYGSSSTLAGTSSNPAVSALGGAQLGSNWFSSPSGYSDSSAVQSAGNANNWWGTTGGGSGTDVPNSTFPGATYTP